MARAFLLEYRQGILKRILKCPVVKETVQGNGFLAPDMAPDPCPGPPERPDLRNGSNGYPAYDLAAGIYLDLSTG